MLFREVNRATRAFCLAVILSCAGPNGDAQAASSGPGSAVPAYSINGKPAQPGDIGADGTISLRTSVSGDLNGDGHEDLAAVLVLNSPGSGIFYYLNVFMTDGKSRWYLVGEEFLGDRIKFDFMDIYGEGSVSSITGVPIHPDDHGKLAVAFFTRSNEQSFAEKPGFYITKHWKVADGVLLLIEDY